MDDLFDGYVVESTAPRKCSRPSMGFTLQVVSLRTKPFPGPEPREEGFSFM